MGANLSKVQYRQSAVDQSLTDEAQSLTRNTRIKQQNFAEVFGVILMFQDQGLLSQNLRFELYSTVQYGKNKRWRPTCATAGPGSLFPEAED